MKIDAPATTNRTASCKWLRISCWCAAIALGAADAWATRFTMNPDGISYLDIGDAYWRGDWHNAINAYWSPLYSWILGFFLKVLKPSAYWEYPLVHLVNLLIYVAALGCFEFFLMTFIADRKRRDQESLKDGQMGLPESAWWLLGYSVFISSSLILIGLGLATPDMCVVAFVYLAAAFVLRTHRGTATRRTFAALGVVLGCAYLTKAVMFPLGFAFLVTAALAARRSASVLRDFLLALLTFLVISSPLIIVLSHAKGRPTFGDSGRITYEIFVNKAGIFVPDSPAVRHEIKTILLSPLTHEFREPIAGTYPPWFDPSYWHEGIKPHLNLGREREMLTYALFEYLLVAWSPFLQLNLTVGLLVLYFVAPRPGLCVKATAAAWPLLIPAFLALVSYSVVYTEPRYVAPFICLLWLSAFSGVRLPTSAGMNRLMSSVVILVGLTTGVSIAARTSHENRKPIPDYLKAAVQMTESGVVPGDRLAVVAKEPFGAGGAFVARLARARIIAETREPEKVLELDPSSRDRFLDSLSRTGAKAMLTDSLSGFANCSRRLGDTQFSLCLLQK